jgi:hypothetical protein
MRLKVVAHYSPVDLLVCHSVARRRSARLHHRRAFNGPVLIVLHGAISVASHGIAHDIRVQACQIIQTDLQVQNVQC